MKSRLYVRDRNRKDGAKDKVRVEPIPAAGRVHVTSHYAGCQTDSLQRISTDDPAGLAADYGVGLLEDGYILTLGDH